MKTMKSYWIGSVSSLTGSFALSVTQAGKSRWWQRQNVYWLGLTHCEEFRYRTNKARVRLNHPENLLSDLIRSHVGIGIFDFLDHLVLELGIQPGRRLA